MVKLVFLAFPLWLLCLLSGQAQGCVFVSESGCRGAVGPAELHVSGGGRGRGDDSTDADRAGWGDCARD